MFCTLFWCRIRKNVHFEGLYIFPLHQHTATSNITILRHSRYITSTEQTLNGGIYQGSSNSCEGDRDSDLNYLASAISGYKLLQPTSVSNCPGPKRDVFSIKIFDTISRISLVGFSILCASYYYNLTACVLRLFSLQYLKLRWVINICCLIS